MTVEQESLRAAQEQQEHIRVLASLMVERFQFMQRNGITFDGKRDFYTVFGYKDQLTLADYRARYDRGGLAGRVVDAFPKATWRGGVELIEDESTSEPSTEFEKQSALLFSKWNLATRFMCLDILSRLSHFAVMLIGAPGDVSTPLPIGVGPESILYLSLFVGDTQNNNATRRVTQQGQIGGLTYGSAVIDALDENSESARFGQPTGYRLQRSDFSAANTLATKVVHWTRIIHVADGCLESDVYGRPALERSWNLFDDLDKVTGGGSEAFYQRANQGRLWSVDKDIKGLTASERQAFKDELDELQHNIKRDVIMRGVTATDLGSEVANFAQQADAITSQIAGANELPKRILIGSEMGELASSQDRDNWRDQVNGRRELHAGPNILRRSIDRFIEYGYLAKPEKYQPRWGSVMNMTQAEKLAQALGWAQANQAQKNAGLPPVVLSREIRDLTYEMPPIEESDLLEEQALVSTAAPTTTPADQQQQLDQQQQGLRAAEGELLDQLADAVNAGDLKRVNALLGTQLV